MNGREWESRIHDILFMTNFFPLVTERVKTNEGSEKEFGRQKRPSKDSFILKNWKVEKKPTRSFQPPLENLLCNLFSKLRIIPLLFSMFLTSLLESGNDHKKGV